MIRLCVEPDLKAGVRFAPAQEQARYLIQVMRKGLGDSILVFNGRDGEWRAELVEIGKRGCVLVPMELVRPQAATPDLELCVALVKRTRLETIVEKAAELGCARVRLLTTRRTNAERAKLERLRAIAIEASEQTGRLDVPEILEPVKLDALLDGWEPGRRLLFCDEGGDARPVIEAAAGQAGPWSVLIGPEGGFDPAERERLRGQGFVTPATLGPRILRADTAAISALTLLQAAVGDWRD